MGRRGLRLGNDPQMPVVPDWRGPDLGVPMVRCALGVICWRSVPLQE